jgi:tetrahydromethanopterin S-methyltransferase subunit G
VLVPAVAFWQVVLAIHIAAVVISFGVVFAYPVFVFVGSRIDRRAIPWFHRMQQQVGRRIISPGLLVVLVAGIYLASKLHFWHYFFVQWGIAAAIVIGGIEGGFMIRQEGRMAELAERDLAAGAEEWSEEYQALSRRVGAVALILYALVLVTIYLMTVQA